MASVRNAFAVSGGSWALSAWTFFQPSSRPDAAADDDQLLGDGAASEPGALSLEALGLTPPRAARGAVSRRNLLEEVRLSVCPSVHRKAL